MNKSTLKYFWSHFKQLKIENEYLFAHRNGEWTAYNLSRVDEEQLQGEPDEKKRSQGELDEEKLNTIAPSLVGSQLYIVHNHPSEPPTPSDFDVYHYQYIRAILSGHNLEVTDFLIVSNLGYYSFKEAGYLDTSPLYQTQTGKEIPVTIPFASTVTLDKKYQEELWNLSQTYTEFIFFKENQFVATHDFSPAFLTNLLDTISQRNVFYRRRTNCPNELERLRAIDAILRPIEIYWVSENETIPLKLQGVI